MSGLDARLRSSLQVLKRRRDQLWVIAQQANAAIAEVAKKAAEAAGLVAVVNVQPTTGAARSARSTNRAHATLGCEHHVVVLWGDLVSPATAQHLRSISPPTLLARARGTEATPRICRSLEADRALTLGSRNGRSLLEVLDSSLCAVCAVLAGGLRRTNATPGTQASRTFLRSTLAACFARHQQMIYGMSNGVNSHGA